MYENRKIQVVHIIKRRGTFLKNATPFRGFSIRSTREARSSFKKEILALTTCLSLNMMIEENHMP